MYNGLMRVLHWMKQNDIKKDQIDLTVFDFNLVPRELVNLAVERLKEQASDSCVLLLKSGDRMAFVVDNMLPLVAYGLFEKALYTAYISVRTNYHVWRLKDLKALFLYADRNKLYNLNSKSPNEYPVVVYRGVSGKGQGYRPKGLSWTSDFEKAKWFASFPEERYGKKLDNCRVFKTTIKKRSVYFYTNEREEKEYVCNITSKHPIELVWQKD